MPQSRGKTKKDEIAEPGGELENCRGKPTPRRRAGLPDENSILEEKQFESPSGKKYRILKTDEMDEYEEEKSTPNDKPER